MSKKAKDPAPGSPAWMTTFSDLMTQILVFFVFLFTMSSVDVIKIRTALISFSAAFGGYSTLQNLSFQPVPMMVPYPESSPDRLHGKSGDALELSLIEEKMHEIVFIVKANSKEEEIQGKYNEQGDLVVTIKDNLLFKSGSAELIQEAIPILERIGNVLADIENPIIVEGHTDNLQPNIRTGFKSNWELSSARALNVAQLFIKRSFVRPERISIAGYGEHKPIVPNTSDKNRSINRRVSVIVVKDNVNKVY